MKLTSAGIAMLTAFSLGGYSATTSEIFSRAEAAFNPKIAQVIQSESPSKDEANSLSNLGSEAVNQEAYERAIEHFQSALSIYRELDNPVGISESLISIGEAYRSLGTYRQAVDYYQQAIAIQQKIGDPLGAGRNAYRVCRAEYILSNFANALSACQQATNFLQNSEESRLQLHTLNLTGIIHIDLGQYELARNLLNQSLLLAVDTEEKSSEGRILSDIGLTFLKQGDFQQAILFYGQAIAIHEGLDEQQELGRTLNKLGEGYRLIGNHEKSVETLQQALAITIQFKEDLRYQGAILDSLGSAYQDQNDYPAALAAYRDALVIHREVGNQRDESVTLKNIGDVLTKQKQVALAIVFYKAAVNVSEDIRHDIQSLPQDTQEAYVETVADTYRQLADLLLENNRLFEAQQVLELLKVEEIREFTRATYTTDGLEYDPVEQAVVDAHGSLIALGAQLSACKPNCDQSLRAQRSSLKRQYDETIQVLKETIRQNRALDDVFYDPASLASDAADIVNAQAGTVLIYPVVLEDRLWLLWTATGGVVGQVPINISRTELNRTVTEFRELLRRRDTAALEELKSTSHELYGWLVEPLKAELDKNNIQRLVFAQDRATRYLPMAALYDGEQFLIENYTVSTVLSAALTDTEDHLGEVGTTQTLALGLSQGTPGRPPLPKVIEELDAIVKDSEDDPLGVYPGKVFVNDDFTFDTISQHVQQHRILHIASHAEFKAGAKDASFILSGKGEPLTIADLGSIDLEFDNLHLVVLSACQTALGSTALDGTEIAGLSSYFLGRNKAKAVLASLWRVDDTGTSLLMQRFYQLLATGELDKAESLRAAQLSLLYGEATIEERMTVLDVQRGGLSLANAEVGEAVGVEHPYYWASFVLIGNSL